MSKDDVEINAAIDRMHANGGGKVQLTEGTFYIDEPIVLKSNVSLVGRGAGTVIIQKTTSADVIQAIGTAGSIIENIQIRNIKIITAVHISNCIETHYTKNLIVDNFYMYSSVAADVDSAIANIIGINTIISNCFIDGSWLGIKIYESIGGCTITNNKMTRCTENTLNIWGNNVTVSNNNLYSNYAGIHGLLLYFSSICNNICDGNDTDGITLSNSSGNNIINNNICNNRSSSGIWISSTCTSNTVSNNKCSSNGTNFVDYGLLTAAQGNNFT